MTIDYISLRGKSETDRLASYHTHMMGSRVPVLVAPGNPGNSRVKSINTGCMSVVRLQCLLLSEITDVISHSYSWKKCYV
jgi:hypothetical protein